MRCTNIMRGMMTSLDFADLARAYARRLEDREAERSGLPVSAARGIVARRLHVSPGTLENLRNGRLKVVAAHLFDRLRSRVEQEITSEISALEHELRLARSRGLVSRDDEMAAAEAALAAARELLRKA